MGVKLNVANLLNISEKLPLDYNYITISRNAMVSYTCVLQVKYTTIISN